jgi:membrane protease YdiL (CAAX protease family)
VDHLGPTEATGSQDSKEAAEWRESKWLAVFELLLVALIFIADAHHLIFFSKTPYLVALGWVSLKIRRSGWRAIGMTVYRNWKTTILLGVLIGVALEAIELFITQPFLVRVLHQKPDLSVFNSVAGNWKIALFFIGLSWSLAAFGEEMVYRGYLMNRMAGLLKQTRAAWIVSLIAVHLVFGLAHAYQGITGIIDEGFMGLLLGVVYLRTRRNLAVPIVAHGVSDSIDVILMFLKMYPGM